MHFTSIIALAIGATLAAAGPVPSPETVVVYATFYNDNACTQGGGEAVSTANPGCLNESGRGSIYFQSATVSSGTDYSLVYSPAANCNCQNYCQNDIINSDDSAHCTSLAGTPAAQSYRFISGGCAANNC